jgi:predicted acetyltransferase
LPWLEITTDTDNEASQKVIVANGGVLLERFTMPQFGSAPALRYRIRLATWRLPCRSQ